MSVLAAVWQATSELAPYLERMAANERIMAIALVVVALIAVGTGVVSLLIARAAVRTLGSIQRHLDRLAPRAEPLLDRVTKIADDASEITRSLRGDVGQMHDTLQEINGRLRDAAGLAEERGRHFAAVLKVVQDEMEDLMLDAAAAARGLRTAGHALRGAPLARARDRGERDEAD